MAIVFNAVLRNKKMYKIGQLAKLASVTPDTVRYYEKLDLLDHEARTEGGFRLYNDEDLKRLKFIRYGRQLGFSLDSIRELLSIRVDPEQHTCKESKEIVQSRLLEVDNLISELMVMRNSLETLDKACCGTSHSSAYCSILEAMEKGEAPILVKPKAER